MQSLYFTMSGQRAPSCTNNKVGDIRLAGGTLFEGLLQVCNGTTQRWRTVCADYWGAEDSRVVCRQLGLSVSGKAIHQ